MLQEVFQEEKTHNKLPFRFKLTQGTSRFRKEKFRNPAVNQVFLKLMSIIENFGIFFVVILLWRSRFDNKRGKDLLKNA